MEEQAVQSHVDEVFIFAHIPKTGGQTLRRFFESVMVFHKEFIHLGPYGIRHAQRLGLAPFEDRPIEERRLARVILGHNVTISTRALVPDKTARHVLFLRDPAETLVSYYNFQMEAYYRRENKPTLPFDTWYTDQFRDNMMLRWLFHQFMQKARPHRADSAMLAEVQDLLDTFWFVGVTEYMDRDLPSLLQRTGTPGVPERANVAGVHYPKALVLDERLRERLYEDNPLDVALYERWRDRLDNSVGRIRSEMGSRPPEAPSPVDGP